MNDLISREAAIAHAISGRTRELEGEKWIRVSEVRESLQTMPSAQSNIARDIATIIENEKDMRVLLNAQPSAERHGRWIIYTVSPWDGEDVKCSVCGEKGCAPYWDYCPHCGSQMVDVVRENEL